MKIKCRAVYIMLPAICINIYSHTSTCMYCIDDHLGHTQVTPEERLEDKGM